MATTTPILIGLPGAGKSTLTRILAHKLNKNIVSTDALFRIYRAIPANSPKEGSEIMRRFLTRAKTEFSDQYSELIKGAQEDSTDSQGRTKLRDSKYFRSLGEAVFRTYEIEMNKWLDEQGFFANAIPDLSASAALFDENRAIFSVENGYKVFLLDTSSELITERLVKDYKLHRERSKEQGEVVRIRGAYEIEVEHALREYSGKDKETVISSTLSRKSSEDREARMSKYRDFAHAVLPVENDNTDQLIERILTH